MRIAYALAGLVIASSAVAADYRPVALSTDQVAAVQAAIAGAMPDPSSAVFDGIVSASDGRQLVVCGFFNGRNAFGGMAGFAPFIGVLDGSAFTLGNYGGTSSDNVAVAHACRGYGLDL